MRRAGLRQLADHLTGKDGGSYAFVATTGAGDPVGWDHCRPIRYVVNPTGAPEGWERIVRAGVDTVSEASGFEFQYEGTSVDRTFEGRPVDPESPPPVLVAWADDSEVPDLAGSTAGIVLMLLSGGAMVQFKYDGFSAMPPMFWVKMVFVATLTLAAILIEFTYAQVKKGNTAAAANLPRFGPLAGISALLAVVFAALAFH